MKRRKLDDFKRALAALAAVDVLGACDQPSIGETNAEPASAATQLQPQLIEQRVIVPGTIFASFDPAAGFDAMQSAAKAACGSEAICKVVIFEPGTVLPTQFPMTDREASEQIGNYTLNRNSGADELLANCDSVTDTPQSSCMAID